MTAAAGVERRAEARVGWCSHELFYWHDAGRGAGLLPVGHCLQPLEGLESESSKRRIEGLLAVSGVLDRLVRLPARGASDEELLSVHSAEHVRGVELLAARGGGEAGAYAPLGYHSASAARLAAGSVAAAVQAALRGGPTRSYCLVRPPGHHAETELAMGFCIYNNVAVAARAALHEGAARVAIVDWDVHHGNGIQKAFYGEPEVLYISVHQDGLFPPGSGAFSERGEGRGRGYTVNLPLPPGSGHGAYLSLFERIVIPLLERYRPDLILVAAGQDCGAYDPLGRQLCTSETFRLMTAQLLAVADALCGGRLVAAHEGGYSPFHVPFLVQAIVTELLGAAPLEDPFLAGLSELPGQRLSAELDARIEQMRGVLLGARERIPLPRPLRAPAPSDTGEGAPRVGGIG